ETAAVLDGYFCRGAGAAEAIADNAAGRSERANEELGQPLGKGGFGLVAEGVAHATAADRALDDVAGITNGGRDVALEGLQVAVGWAARAYAGGLGVDASAVLGAVREVAAGAEFRGLTHHNIVAPGQLAGASGTNDVLVIVAEPVGAATAGNAVAVIDDGVT